METTVFALLLRELGERQESIRDHLANGGAKSYEDYCRIVGAYGAMQQTVDDVKELEKRFIAD